MARALDHQGDGSAHPSGPDPVFIRRLAALARLDPEETGAARAVLGRPMPFPMNGDLVIEGMPATGHYAIEQGWACSYKLLSDGRRQILGFLLPGDCTAASELASRPPCSVLALTQMVVRPYQLSGFDSLRERSASFRAALDCAARADIATLRDHLVSIGRRNAYQRLAYLILELHYRLRIVGLAEAAAFDMPITQEMIADALGLSNVHVNRTLRRLAENDVVSLGGGRLTIGDFEMLSDIADFEESYLGQFARERALAGRSRRDFDLRQRPYGPPPLPA